MWDKHKVRFHIASNMDEQLARNIAYGLLIITFGLMVWFIAVRAKQNRETAIADAAPAVAGDDELGGVAQDPSAFDEPDEEALEEMGELLGDDDDDS